MAGLRDDVTREEKGRQFDCPSCGAAVQVALGSTKRLTCGHCHSVLDLTQQLGPEMVVARQEEQVQPLIALGSQGPLQGKTWQVVGFQHRMGHEPGDEDEHFGWSEYLLYNRQRGFQFLVDSTEGWSLVKPTTGVPKLSPMADSAKYLGVNYKRQYQYWAETGYVTGEFYWPVQRGQRTFNRDFAAGDKLLNQEEAGSEITWSVGSKLNAKAVADMFKMDLARLDTAPVVLKDAAPTAGLNWQTLLVLIVLFLVFWAIVKLADDPDCDPNIQNCATSSGSRSSGGSWGGYSSGGSHK
jgi:ribosomal protein S27AE